MGRLMIKSSAAREIRAMLALLELRKAYNPNQKRGEDGRWAKDGGGSVSSNNETLEQLKAELKQSLIDMAVPRMKVAYTTENFKKLFGEWNRVNTPGGRVTVPFSQFEKLEMENRKGWLGAMYQTITDPVFIIQASPEKKLYVKTFTPERAGVITFLSVIIDKDNSQFNITNHEKPLNNILNKIKKADDVVYKKATNTSYNSLTFGKSRRGVLSEHMSKENNTQAKGSHILPLSPDPIKKSSRRIVMTKSQAREIWALLSRIKQFNYRFKEIKHGK